MSEIPNTYSDQLRRITDHVATLRRRIMLCILTEGLGRVLLVLVAMLTLDFVIDWSFRLDLPQRIIMLGLLLCGGAASAVYFIVRPLRYSPTDDGLILELERQTPKEKNILISAWQLSQAQFPNELGTSASLVEATLSQAAAAANRLDPRSLINVERLRWNLLLVSACLMFLGIAVFAVTSTSIFGIWFKRNLLLGSETWPQKTYLIVEGLDDDGKIPMVRGEDHQLRVTIDPRSEKQDVDVFFDYRDSGSRYRQKMRKTEIDGTTRFEHTFGTVVSEFTFQVFGGDARTDWIGARLVEPPGIAELTLEVIPPDYTVLEPQLLPRGRSPYDILRGSKLRIAGTTNKPMKTARLRGPERDFELEITEGNNISMRLEPNDLLEGKYVFALTDTMNLTTKRPPGFTIRLQDDQPPVVRANTYGIGGLVVPRARIPLRIGAEDQFAISSLQLQFEWTGESNNATSNKGQVAISEAVTFLGQPKLSVLSRWDLEPLNLPVGVSLLFNVTATDNRVPEQGIGESKTFLLRVVTEDELRTDLLRREREQREDFERQINEQINLKTEMEALNVELQQNQIPETERTLRPTETLATARQRQRDLATTLERIASRFEELLVEAENNRLDEENGRLRNRLENQIITPLRKLDLNELKSVEQGLEAARVSLTDRTAVANQITKVIALQETIIVKMNEILGYMVKAEGYQEAINLLRQIERTQQDVLETTDEQRRKRIQSIFEGQENLNPK